MSVLIPNTKKNEQVKIANSGIFYSVKAADFTQKKGLKKTIYMPNTLNI